MCVVITRIFNPCKYWTVTIQTFLKTPSNSVSVLFIASYCSTFVCTVFSFVRFSALFNSVFDYSVFDYSVYFFVLILELYSRYFDPYLTYNNHPAVNNHQTADSTIFVLV
jgi:hypothetical protein